LERIEQRRFIAGARIAQVHGCVSDYNLIG
jgi:hypothetical protein